GGGLLFALTVALVQFPHIFGIADAGLAVKYSVLSVAMGGGLFTLFTIFWVKEEKQQLHTDEVHLFVDGFRQLAATFREIRYLKTLFLFLIAYWLYIDGVDTIIKMAVDYGLSLGFDDSDLILALLIVQFIGFPAAILYSKLGEKWGVRKAIFLAIGVYSAVTLWGMMMTNRNEFYLLAVVIGLVQGGIQALSRSYYSRLIPVGREGEFYGFYNMLGKFAAIVGPALMGIVGLAVKRILMPPSPTEMQLVEIGRLASRWSIGSILILFVAGAILLYLVDEEKGERETALLEAQ
ncbi:MAG: MFS transporter, partial [Candidatus Marinimicrobia bacterium]|nr:MFS transporter [Candidatus Neomarinimicrobiota bacterium]